MKDQIDKYIGTVLELVDSKDSLEQVLYDLSALAEKVGYKSVIDTAGEGPEVKKAAILSQLDVITLEPLRAYLNELLEANDFWLFEPAHFKVFQEELNRKAEEIIFFHLTVPIELKAEDRNELERKFSERFEKKVMIDLSVDKNILGGAIIKKDNYIFDFSLKTKLNKLNSQWKKAIEKAANA